jgi:HD-like signal output (HDOD) protein
MTWKVSTSLQNILKNLTREPGKANMGSILKSYVQKVKELPTLPATALEILKIDEDSFLCIDKLKKIVERDPAISARILSVANSAYFGYPVRATKISDAIMRIGFSNVRSVAVGVALLSFLDDGREASGYRKLFDHSVCVSLTGRFVARYLGMSFAGDILIDGLLHDLGYLALHSYFPETYREIMNCHEKESSLLNIEKEVLGYTHADVGFWLADQWNLPASIIDANLYHHTPSLAEKNADRVAVLHIADYIAAGQAARPVENDPNYPFDRCSLDILKISEKDLKDMEESICSGPLLEEIASSSRQKEQCVIKNS